ncbi:zinc-binding dehydrogenase [Patulibacter sp. NPDC049589]|uniref:quinone oxidoreductase family protein n=1 Tax=Patulibacter sp. NPDC049589 TaxID=3154731 RepID=UPI003442718A
MQAVRLHGYGGLDELVFEEAPDPVVPDGWVLVELRAAALNWHDCLVRQGRYPAPLPLVPGADGAGVRRDTGEEVVILPSLWWGDGQEAPGTRFEILGDRVDGTYAELVAVPEENVFPKPRALSWAEAAALPLAGVTAHRALFGRGGLRAGERVLILGAGGGVATFLVAFADRAGARVTVTSSSQAGIDQAVALGAAGGVLYTDEGWPQAARDEAGGEGFDLVVDPVGAWADGIATLRPGGRLVSFGANAAEHADVSIRPFYFGQYSLLGTTMGSPRDFRAMLGLVDRMPGWRPVVGTELPLDRAADAQALLEGGGHRGKVVLTTG